MPSEMKKVYRLTHHFVSRVQQEFHTNSICSAPGVKRNENYGKLMFFFQHYCMNRLLNDVFVWIRPSVWPVTAMSERKIRRGKKEKKTCSTFRLKRICLCLIVSFQKNAFYLAAGAKSIDRFGWQASNKSDFSIRLGGVDLTRTYVSNAVGHASSRITWTS